jgi:ribosomal protein S18 acetylase RimI-like enzyme
VQLGGDAVGIAGVRYLDALTDGYTRDTAYLTRIRVHEQHRGRGVGTDFVRLLVAHLLGMGYRYLHTDTAGENIGAQRFYERRGFEQQGYTRSYVRAYERA